MVGGRGDITIGKLREQPPFWALFNTIPWPTSYCAPELTERFPQDQRLG